MSNAEREGKKKITFDTTSECGRWLLETAHARGVTVTAIVQEAVDLYRHIPQGVSELVVRDSQAEKTIRFMGPQGRVINEDGKEVHYLPFQI